MAPSKGGLLFLILSLIALSIVPCRSEYTIETYRHQRRIFEHTRVISQFYKQLSLSLLHLVKTGPKYQERRQQLKTAEEFRIVFESIITCLQRFAVKWDRNLKLDIDESINKEVEMMVNKTEIPRRCEENPLQCGIHLRDMRTLIVSLLLKRFKIVQELASFKAMDKAISLEQLTMTIDLVRNGELERVFTLPRCRTLLELLTSPSYYELEAIMKVAELAKLGKLVTLKNFANLNLEILPVMTIDTLKKFVKLHQLMTLNGFINLRGIIKINTIITMKEYLVVSNTLTLENLRILLESLRRNDSEKVLKENKYDILIKLIATTEFRQIIGIMELKELISLDKCLANNKLKQYIEIGGIIAIQKLIIIYEIIEICIEQKKHPPIPPLPPPKLPTTPRPPAPTPRPHPKPTTTELPFDPRPIPPVTPDPKEPVPPFISPKPPSGDPPPGDPRTTERPDEYSPRPHPSTTNAGSRNPTTPPPITTPNPHDGPPTHPPTTQGPNYDPPTHPSVTKPVTPNCPPPR